MATATLNTIQYATAFGSARYGEAAALGFIIAILVIGASLVQLRVGRGQE
jgi:ABC-type sugar transport system permease subunit